MFEFEQHAFEDGPIERGFVDGPFDEFYRADDRVGTMFGAFVIVAVLIGCLGLIAWATVYANTLRLARTSAIHALRYE